MTAERKGEGVERAFEEQASFVPGGMTEAEVHLCKGFFRAAWEQATERERERCAKVAGGVTCKALENCGGPVCVAPQDIAARIRSGDA